MLYFAPWKIALIVGAIVVGVLFSVPNFVPESVRLEQTSSEGEAPEPKGIWTILPHQTVNLGLDLRGGSHIVFEVDMEEVREERLTNLAEDVRNTLRTSPPIFSARPAVVGEEVVVRLSDAEDMDAAMARLRDLNEPVTTTGGGQGMAQTLDISRGEDGQTIRLSVTDAAFEAIQQRTVSQSINVIRRRIDSTGTTEPTIARQGDDRVLVQVPGESNPQRIIDLVGTAARLTFHMVESDVDIGPAGEARTPPGVMVLPYPGAAEFGASPYIAVQRRALITGDQLVDSSQQFQDGQVVVAFRFNTSGATAFGEATSQNVGRRFAVVLDGEVISAPRINSPILGGSGIIEGGFTVQSASDLANMLNAGALPASLTPVELRTVGPGLGQDSIEAGQTAVLIGFALVILFMLAAYGSFGVVSTVALLVNVVLILGALSGLQATLTLPGIGGIILTIGMAVDANVLIFERIREEYRNGRTVVNAVEIGYDRAFAAILDANVTTFIAASVLYMMGAGPVRGFAVTLGIGILTSVFTAFTFSRLLIAVWLRRSRPKTLAM
ncbi:protein translocase subunit SecD [Marinicauda pacifica]|uniref:Protein translocase subunit SecD n=1 Tax=Marinicauda pacifica TaxID=1133559 RepID=A0A4S2HDU6_9PROT|nr:protein translocase subunit SecD [Marinicauda pacifica]TGY94225.1 protein translocase subunit SecD [Marinicauda pacifica]GGE33973.1 protein translocase subunit SecD [Marinicauda pacifica]